MRTVKIRLYTEICGSGFNAIVNHIEEPLTYEDADELFGHRLDRRKNYCIINGKVCESCEWTSTCSGCEGGGCPECGYHGRARNAQWVPVPKIFKR